MQQAAWRDILDRTQHEYLTLITGSLFAVMIMTTLRDFMFAREFASTWLYFVEYFSVSLSLVIWVAAIVKMIPARFAHPATLVSLLAVGIKSGIAVWIWNFNGPGNIMITLFATGLVMLSFPYALLAQLVIFAVWVTPAFLNLDFTAATTNTVIALIGAGLGQVVLQRRIATLRQIVQLENRVEALESILPMCSGCKKTRDEDGNWISIEQYIEDHDEGTVITHGLCPECKQTNYGHLPGTQEQAPQPGVR